MAADSSHSQVIPSLLYPDPNHLAPLFLVLVDLLCSSVVAGNLQIHTVSKSHPFEDGSFSLVLEIISIAVIVILITE